MFLTIIGVTSALILISCLIATVTEGDDKALWALAGAIFTLSLLAALSVNIGIMGY